jgi:hypothetical protein
LNRRPSLPARLVQMLQGPNELHVAIEIGNESASRQRLSVTAGAFSGTDSQNLLDRCHESWRVTSTFNDMGQIGPHCKRIVDNAIVDRVVHCEACLSGVSRRLDAVNVHSIRHSNQFQIVRPQDFPFRVLHFQPAHGFAGAFVQNLKTFLAAGEEITFSPLAQSNDDGEQLSALLG